MGFEEEGVKWPWASNVLVNSHGGGLVVHGRLTNDHKGGGWSKKGLVNLTEFLDAPQVV